MGTHVRQLVKIVKEICLENNIETYLDLPTAKTQ